MKRLVKLGQKRGSKKKPSGRDNLLSGVDYVLLSGGGSLLGDFTVKRPSEERATTKWSHSRTDAKYKSYM